MVSGDPSSFVLAGLYGVIVFLAVLWCPMFSSHS
jgi:hypothetical protein